VLALVDRAHAPLAEQAAELVLARKQTDPREHLGLLQGSRPGRAGVLGVVVLGHGREGRQRAGPPDGINKRPSGSRQPFLTVASRSTVTSSPVGLSLPFGVPTLKSM